LSISERSTSRTCPPVERLASSIPISGDSPTCGPAGVMIAHTGTELGRVVEVDPAVARVPTLTAHNTNIVRSITCSISVALVFAALDQAKAESRSTASLPDYDARAEQFLRQVPKPRCRRFGGARRVEKRRRGQAPPLAGACRVGRRGAWRRCCARCGRTSPARGRAGSQGRGMGSGAGAVEWARWGRRRERRLLLEWWTGAGWGIMSRFRAAGRGCEFRRTAPIHCEP
jgi:hypothetical protein